MSSSSASRSVFFCSRAIAREAFCASVRRVGGGRGAITALPGFRVAHAVLSMSANGRLPSVPEVDGADVGAMEGAKRAGAVVPSEPDAIETGRLDAAVLVALSEADSIVTEVDTGAEETGGSAPERELGILGSMRSRAPSLLWLKSRRFG